MARSQRFDPRKVARDWYAGPGSAMGEFAATGKVSDARKFFTEIDGAMRAVVRLPHVDRWREQARLEMLRTWAMTRPGAASRCAVWIPHGNPSNPRYEVVVPRVDVREIKKAQNPLTATESDVLLGRALKIRQQARSSRAPRAVGYDLGQASALLDVVQDYGSGGAQRFLSRRNPADCRRCRGVGQVKLGPRMVRCPTCKGGAA